MNRLTLLSLQSAADATARLQEDEPPLGLDLQEAICPRCRLAYFVAGTDGVCRDCAPETPLLVLVG